MIKWLCQIIGQLARQTGASSVCVFFVWFTFTLASLIQFRWELYQQFRLLNICGMNIQSYTPAEALNSSSFPLSYPLCAHALCFTFLHSLPVFLISLSLPFLCFSNSILGQTKVNHIEWVWGGGRVRARGRFGRWRPLTRGGDRMVCEMVRGIQKGEARMIEYRRGR